MKKGFTLIELLVVVLIIGILSSIALPQYERAVKKSRASKAWAVLKTLDQAALAYCLENPEGWAGANATYNGGIPVAVPTDNDWTYQVSANCSQLNQYPIYSTAYARGKDSMKLSDGKAPDLGIRNGKRFCGGDSGSSKDKVAEFCKSLGVDQEVSSTVSGASATIPSWYRYSDHTF